MKHIESIAKELLDTIDPFVNEYMDSTGDEMRREFNDEVKNQISKALRAGIEIGSTLQEQWHQKTAEKWMDTGIIDYSSK